MRKGRYRRYLRLVERIMTVGARDGAIHLTVEDRNLDGRTVRIRGRDVVNFGSAGYLGLELDERLIAAATDAVQRYGTQFSSSRTYVSSGQYPELESLLAQVFGAPVIVAPSTTLAHLCAIPVLVQDGDAVLLDEKVHASVQLAVETAKARGVEVAIVAHNRLDALAARVQELGSKRRRIWYMVDGVYSMHGDLAPLADLATLLEELEKLYLYVDDAHGMSWTGQNGRGHALTVAGRHRKLMVVTSLNKGFGAAGGAMVFPNERWRKRVWTCAPPLIFSGPIQPPMLGAAIASARLHLSDEIYDLQAALSLRIEHCNRALSSHGLPLIAETPSPIFFVKVGMPNVGSNLVSRLLEEGFLVNIGAFPAASLTETGLRFAVTLHHSLEDIENLAAAIAHHLPLARKEESSVRAVKDFLRKELDER